MKYKVQKFYNSPHRRYLLFFILVFGLYHLPHILSDFLEPILISKIRSTANSAGFELSINKSSYSFPLTFFAESVIVRNFESRTFPPVSLQNFSFVLKKSIPPLAAELNLQGYQGSTSCTITSQSKFPALPYQYSCIISSLSLESHPSLFALGVKGRVSGSIDGVLHQNPDLNKASFSLVLESGSIDPEKMIFSSVIKVPPFDSIEIEVRGSISGSEIRINEGLILTSYGKVSSFEGNMVLRGEVLSEYQAKGTLQLNQDGLKTIAPWLSLLAPDHNFRRSNSNFSITSIQGQAQIHFGN
jgi:hypothetical protein